MSYLEYGKLKKMHSHFQLKIWVEVRNNENQSGPAILNRKKFLFKGDVFVCLQRYHVLIERTDLHLRQAENKDIYIIF